MSGTVVMEDFRIVTVAVSAELFPLAEKLDVERAGFFCRITSKGWKEELQKVAKASASEDGIVALNWYTSGLDEFGGTTNTETSFITLAEPPPLVLPPLPAVEPPEVLLPEPELVVEVVVPPPELPPVNVFTTILTIVAAKIITTKPIIEFIKVLRPFSARSSLPAEVINQKPPMIIKITATAPVKPNSKFKM